MDAMADDGDGPIKRQRASGGVLDAMVDDGGAIAAGGGAAAPSAAGATAGAAAAAAEAAAAASALRVAGQKYMNSVLKLYVMQAEPNYAQPWQVRPQRAATGSGFVIEGRRLLTNAHVVLSGTTVHVRREGMPKKWPARVLCCAPAVDLALLTVDDDAFWENLNPLQLADVPHLQDSVVVIGYPVGGDSICVTKGVVSRVDLRPYVAGGSSLLTVQIDAAINPGNSGGPAFSDVQQGLVVGVAFSKLRNTDNIGYIIPAPVVFHFLAEYERFGTFRGVAGRGFQWQRLENVALRARHGISSDASGVLVARLDPLAPSSASGALQLRDILLSVEGVPIADDGTVAFRGAERLDFTHLWRQRHVGDTLRAEVLRGGQRTAVTFSIAPPHTLVPLMHTVDCYPSYYIVGGLVFLPLSVPFLEHGYGASWRKVTPVKLQALLSEYRREPDEEVVLLFQILSAELNYGYRGTSLWVSSFNGTKVRNLAQMARLVEEATGPWLEWETDDGSSIVLDRAAALAHSGVILKQHAIANDRSADLRGEEPLRFGAAAAAAAATPDAHAPGIAPAAAQGGSAALDASQQGGSGARPLAGADGDARMSDAAPLASQRPADALGDFAAPVPAPAPHGGVLSPLPTYAQRGGRQLAATGQDSPPQPDMRTTAPF